jgi:hypothetical protein
VRSRLEEARIKTLVGYMWCITNVAVNTETALDRQVRPTLPWSLAHHCDELVMKNFLELIH